ncbi:hypothetical protein ACMA1I_18325 [Pontibacter sp. 13R65]|uniref:hypothetical protein n=1 Tax=Pontibacter sp. 13R65 TaxID=3127458 RepID=UPI00301C467A
MMLFVNDALRHATSQEEQQVLDLDIMKQQVSIWKPTAVGSGFYFAKNIRFSDMVKHIAKPHLLDVRLQETVAKVISGEAAKKELFGYCVATFKPDECSKVRRLKHNYSTYTKLVQLDLDLKNEPNCTTEYVETIIKDIFELTDLGKHILLCGKSISGKGIYLYLQCDTDNTEVLEVVITRVYELLQKVFQFQNPAKTLDTSVSDVINRLRYYAPDPDLIINPFVEQLNTAGIKAKKKACTSSYVSQAGNTFREHEIIRGFENRHLLEYHQANYISGFHNAFLKFSNACIGKGVSRATLERYTQQRYGQLYNREKRMSYLPELMRIIDCAEKNILRK